MSAPTCAPSTPLLCDAAQLSATPFFVLEVALFTASEHPVEPLLLLCWQLRFFQFLCDAPGSALYVCCECGHTWVMCVGVKHHTLEMSTFKYCSLGLKEWSAALLGGMMEG